MKEVWSEEFRARILEALQANGWEPELHVVDGSDLCATVEDALRQRVGAVIAGGGDGTTTTIAAMMRRAGIPLGILPFGTINLAARDLKTPLDPLEAVRTLRPGVTRTIDLLEANGEACLCLMILGFYPVMQAKAEEFHGRAWWVKCWRFALAMLRTYFRTPNIAVRLTLEDGTVENVRTRFLAIIPGEYEDTTGMLPRRTNLSSGRCTIYISRHRTRRAILAAAARYLLGRTSTDPHLEITTARSLLLEVRGHRTILAAIDGEILRLQVPISVEILPRSLTVLKPVAAEPVATAVAS